MLYLDFGVLLVQVLLGILQRSLIKITIDDISNNLEHINKVKDIFICKQTIWNHTECTSQNLNKRSHLFDYSNMAGSHYWYINIIRNTYLQQNTDIQYITQVSTSIIGATTASSRVKDTTIQRQCQVFKDAILKSTIQHD